MALNIAIQGIIKDPSIGPIKRGDLREIRVHKYRDQKDQLLIAYWIPDNKTLELIDFGSHENFYRDLKRK